MPDLSDSVTHMIPVSASDEKLIEMALAEAQIAFDEGEIPVGAVIIDHEGRIVARAHNTQLCDLDPTAHAEMLAIRKATKMLGSRYLEGCTLAVTLEPCLMCAGAIAHARIPRVIFGAWDEKSGASGSLYDVLRDRRLPHPPVEVVGGVLAESVQAQLHEFFNSKRRAQVSEN